MYNCVGCKVLKCDGCEHDPRQKTTEKLIQIRNLLETLIGESDEEKLKEMLNSCDNPVIYDAIECLLNTMEFKKK